MKVMTQDKVRIIDFRMPCTEGYFIRERRMYITARSAMLILLFPVLRMHLHFLTMLQPLMGSGDGVNTQ